MKKRLFAMLLCVVMLMTMLPAVALADEPYGSWEDAIEDFELKVGDTIAIGEHVYTYGGEVPSYGLDFTSEASSTNDTVYMAGNGKVLWNVSPSHNKLTLDNVTISDISGECTFKLPDGSEIELKGVSVPDFQTLHFEVSGDS